VFWQVSEQPWKLISADRRSLTSHDTFAYAAANPSIGRNDATC
jgi:hypothetical protein